MNVDGLRALYLHDGCARALLDSLAERKRNNRRPIEVADVELLAKRQGVRHSRRDVIATLKRLEELSCGRFVVGRRGQPSRFEWLVDDPIAVGRAAREPQSADATAPHDQDGEAGASTDVLLVHKYLLRPSITVTLSLPRDLTSKEATRLAEFVRTLPFSDGDQ